MAKIKQLIIAVENRPGAVAEIAKVLGNAKVNVFSLLGTSQGTGGTIQLSPRTPSEQRRRWMRPRFRTRKP